MRELNRQEACEQLLAAAAAAAAKAKAKAKAKAEAKVVVVPVRPPSPASSYGTGSFMMASTPWREADSPCAHSCSQASCGRIRTPQEALSPRGPRGSLPGRTASASA